MNSKTLIFLCCGPLLACVEPEQVDYGQVCATAKSDGGQTQIVVEATSRDCASDHQGASFECSLAANGSEVTISTVFQDGNDPNSGCPGPLLDTCSIEVEAGAYTLSFGGEVGMLTVPDGDQICFPGGGGDTGGSDTGGSDTGG